MAYEFWVNFATGSFFVVIFVAYNSFWRLFLSPLKTFPGPKLAALTLWYEFYYDIVKSGGGNYVWEIEKMHKKYGPIVRISPFELHVSDPEFYEEIYASGNCERDKYAWQISSGNSAQAMGFTLKHHHHRIRREALNPYFSKGNVLRLEDRIKKRIYKLSERIDSFADSQEPVNLTVAYLALTMDVITDYCFGKGSGMLEQEFTTKWKDTITTVMQNTSVINHFRWLPWLMENTPHFLATKLPDLSALLDLKKDIQRQVNVVLTAHRDTPSLNHHHSIFQELKDSKKLPEHEKTATRFTDEATILVIAASESPAKTLALIHFYLMTNPAILAKVRMELKSIMKSSSQIPPLTKLESLPYLTAIVKEGLRMHGGITARSSRVALKEILTYKQWRIPAGTPLSTSSYFIHQNPDIFPDPLEFKPDRWVCNDRKDGGLDRFLVAFGKGTRNCIGLNLGRAEIYLTLAHMIMNFDMELYATDVSDVRMVRDWYVPQPRLGSVGVRARVLSRGTSNPRLVG